MNLVKSYIFIVFCVFFAKEAFCGNELREHHQKDPGNWHGTFICNGITFAHDPENVIVRLAGLPDMLFPEFNVKATGQVNGWKPKNELTLKKEMTPQEFYEAVSAAADIIAIYPPAFAQSLGFIQYHQK